MMDSVEIPTSELNCVNSVANSVQDTNNETTHDGENHVCSVRDQPRCITPEQMAFSKIDPPVFDKPLYGTALDPALLTVTSLEDYSDVSSCSEADFGRILNNLEKNPDQSSECQNTGSSRDENDLEKNCHAGRHNTCAASDKNTENQDYVCRASPETEDERRSGSFDNVIEGDNQEERSFLNLEYQCSSLTTESENGCPLKTEEQMKGGFLIRNTDCGVAERSKNCKDTTTTQISSVCALDLNGTKRSIEGNEKYAISTGNTGVQNDCHSKGINNTCEIKNNTPEYELKYDVKNTAHDNEPEYNRTKSSQEVEHSSFEFLQSCFGLSSLDQAKLDQNAANFSSSGSMIHQSQNCEVNQTLPPVLLSATLECVPRGQIKEAADDGLQEPPIPSTYSSTSVSQEPGQQNDSREDQITRIKKSASLLSSKKLMRKLQPVVLVKTTKRNVKDGNMYLCSVCQKNTQNLDELIEHHHCKHSKHTFQYCLTCGAYFSNGSLAAQHLCEQIGPKDKQLSDTILSTTKQLTEKLNAKYLCKYCQKPFVKMSYHQDHEQRHRIVTQHRCDCCGLYFPHAKKLIAHKRKVKCTPLILEPNEQRKKCSETDTKNPAKPMFTFGVDGCQIGLHDCFVKLVDINKKPSPQKINCPVCGKRFKLRAQLKVHLRSHTGAKPFKCNKCKKIFKYSWNLDKHKKELCSGNITKQYTSEPSITGRFACPTCPQIFRYSYNRTRHMRQRCLKEYMHIGKGKVGNRYKCPLCNETFSLASNRNRHIKNTCFQQYKLQRKTNKKKLVKENIKEEKEEKQVLPTENLPSYKCKVCPASFAHKSGVYRHMKKHSLLQCSTVPVGKHDSPTDVKGSDSNNERPQSPECSSQKPSDMATSHPFLCSFCDKCFSSSDSLKDHLRLHGGKKPFHCLDCGKNFGRRGHLIAHKNVHKRRIQCSVCKKIVPTIGDLLKHRQSHIKKGMLQCPDCPMQFKFPVFLLRHVASHAKKEAMLKSSLPAETPSKKSTDEKVKEFKESFHCGICQKSFVDSKTLSEHCLTHLPKPSVSKCPVCKHNFTSRTALIRHIRLHTGEKPFPCKTCGMHFHRKEPLQIHQVKCKGLQEKPLSSSTTAQTQEKCEVKAASKSEKVPKKFTCSYCPHIFTMSGNLKMHEKAHLANNLVPCLKCGKYYKKNKIYGHRKRCNAKESTSVTFKSEKSGNAHKSECKDNNLVVTNRTCRISKEMGTNIKDSLKEQCPHCSKRFQYRSYLLRHLQSHLGKKQFACKHCGQKYGNQNSCQQHEVLCDGVLRQHEAKQLNESEETRVMPDSAASLKECTVIIGENGEQLKCNFCTKTFTKPRYLRRHILTHTEVKPYRCKTCENCFSRYDHLKHHQTRCRGKKQQLEVHPEQITLDHVGSQAKRQPQSDVFECSTCSKKFSTNSNLTRHISMLHSTFKPFSCKRCGTGFTSKDSLRRHNVRVNCKMSSAECLEPVQMPTKSNTSVQSCRETSKLMQRIEGHYSNKWKFQCEYCPRRFKTQTQLKLHTRLHTGEKPFGCACCDERFIRRDYLKRHLTKCSGKREGPKVLCDRCGGLFTQEALEIHQNNCIITLKSTDCPVSVSSISSPSKVKAFSCVNCNDRFLLFSQLQQHILTKHRSDGLQQSGILEYEQLSSNLHIKEEPVDDNYSENLPNSCQIYDNNGHENTDGEREKPFECEQCNLRFITNSGLGMHMRTHTTIYPLSCQKCNKGFWSKNVQQKHMRKCKDLEVTKKEPNTKDLISSELECTPNDKVLVFNKGSNTTGTGVLQTKFSCKDQDKGSLDKGENAVVHKYQCSECEQSFTDGLMLISHLEAHGREDQERRLGKSHRCHICGKTFDQAGVLQRHVKTQHQETVKNTCPDCFRSFRYPSDLDIHRSCHDPNRPFVCNTCELRFWTSKSLSTHQRLSHSASEPLKTIEPTLKTDRVSPKVFTCHPCNKIYTVKRSYMKHCRVKHKGSSKSLDSLKSATTEHQLSNNESDGSDADDKDVSDDDSDSAPYFPCHVCGKTFLTSESLEDHQRCHLGEKPYECEECGKCFVQLVNLQQHQRSHKSEFQCQMCGKGFVSLFALRKHKHTHVRKRPHRCTKCHLSFTRSSQLTEHMITHRDENFPCDLCHENFSCKSSRAEHRKIHTEAEEELPPLIPPAKQTSSPPASMSPSLSTVQQYRYRCEICQVRFLDPEQLSEHGCNPAKERPYWCKDCNKHFLHGSHLKKHQLTHQLSGTRSFQCNSCHMSFSHRHHFLTHLQTHGGEESSKSQIDDEVKISNTDDSNQDKIYRCPICPESFSQVLELANHLSVHANMCNVCNKTFSTKQQLEKHEQCHLSAATQYECTECGRSFLGSDAFRQHYCVHQKHLSCSSLSTTDKKRCLENSSEVLTNNEEEEEVDVGEDFYNCSTCNKRFPSNISLQEHQKLHEFDRPFKCLVCGKGFAKKKYLTQHQQIHNERPYQCDLCSNSFKTEQSLLSHRKTHDAHRKYHCSVCDKSYRTPYDLSRHEQKHPELQTFSEVSGDHRCDMCYKSFSLLSQLRQHQETHVGQVVYECTECDKAFAFPHLLEEHQQTHGTSTDSFQSQSPSDILFQSPVVE
ncbi:zinc finger protein 1035 [Pangasianodon hypophthalmus]|uniref:zinc finger protein 1035 n=1 Tax=Pangasianodon hypophthalmus TaxID=310915 RepID=UPI0023080DBF|nr:zinc finger protein 1035 [Pangasianodon hypophthalmus]XP_026769498.3 zinc finger protein 1035 [Pangasianodon hypophthalmus]